GRTANNYVLQDTMTYIRGNHTFRFGFDLTDQRSKQSAPFRGRGVVTYNSSPGYTSFANFVDDFAGDNGSALREFGSALYYPFLFRQAYFFQDRWRASESLTLTLGLRYESFGVPINTLRTPAFTGLFNIDSVTGTGPFNQPNQVDKDTNNFAPTVGVAYSPASNGGWRGRLYGDRKTVIRAGYQIGYDSFFNNIASNAAASSPNNIATNVTSTVNGAAPRGRSNLFGALPITASALTPLDAQALVLSNLVNPYYQRWSLGVQRSLPFNLLLDVSYVGTKGTNLFITEDLNPLVPANLRITPPGFTGTTSGRLDNTQGQRTIRTNGGDSNYHAGQLNLTRRFASGFSLTGAYTWSKLIDNVSELFVVNNVNAQQNTALPTIFGGLQSDRAVSFFDRRHRASITYVYELPFYKGKNSFAGRILGGWQLSGITTFESGAPLNVINGQDGDGIGGALDRPDFNPSGQEGVRAVPARATLTVNPCSVAVGAVYYTNPDARNACINPANAQYIGILSGTGRTGNLGRNTLRTDGTNNWNVNFLKSVSITEGRRLEFRAEFYNIFNHPQYGQVSVSPFAPLANVAATGVSGNVFTSTAGQFLQTNTVNTDGGGRVIRYQLKFIF
ncbi:MAG: TonB-dependent receptor domain-containing protein, partial [Pyrinomonadaceae bacterium]